MAYIIEKKDFSQVQLPYLPLHGKLKNGTTVILDRYQESDFVIIKDILNQIIEEGTSYPQEYPLDDQGFQAYYLVGEVFVLKQQNNGQIVGSFYIKPNFPGRCNHFCNTGIIVDKNYRGLNAGKIMGQIYLRIAKDLGYLSSFFNLVFVNNPASIKLWQSLGFQQLATIPKVGRLKDGTLVDACQFIYDLTSELPEMKLDLSV